MDEEREKRYQYWRDKIPGFHFPPQWKITIIPPFLDAMIRFRVEYGNMLVSCYLDCYEELGLFGAPYWEIFSPYSGNTFRCGINETELLMEKINDMLGGRL